MPVSLYSQRLTAGNSVDVGPHRDVTGEISAAAKAAGLHSGLYHSLFEWYNPIYLADKASGFKDKNFVPKAMGELVDLVTRYEPEVLWSDGDWEAPDAYWDAPANFLAWLVTNSSVKDTVVCMVFVASFPSTRKLCFAALTSNAHTPPPPLRQ